MKFFNLSVKGSSELSNNGMSRIVITLSTHPRLCISCFKLPRLFIDLSDIISCLGEYVKTKKSFAPYLSLISLKSFKSGSFSNNKVSEEASSLKSFEKYPKDIIAIIRNEKITFGF